MITKSFQMAFDGQILKRGFWLYILEIRHKNQKYLYIGRTGDSSSPNASSPFNRIGQHLDTRPNAKGNSLSRRLQESNINPQNSRFRMLSIGPLFPEQETFEDHKPLRDKMATIEHEIAQYLRENNFNVLGIHHKADEVDKKTINKIKKLVTTFLKEDKCS